MLAITSRCFPFKIQSGWAGNLQDCLGSKRPLGSTYCSVKTFGKPADQIDTNASSFRTELIKYHNAWQFLPQIVDYQDPQLHRRAILENLLFRNLHVNDYSLPEGDSYMAGVELNGLNQISGQNRTKSVKTVIYQTLASTSRAPAQAQRINTLFDSQTGTGTRSSLRLQYQDHRGSSPLGIMQNR